MSDITSKLGGYQHIIDGVVQADDLLTHTAFGRRQASLASEVPEIVGLTVKEVTEFFNVNVYRKIPVAKQGGLDHKFPGLIYNGEQKQEIFMSEEQDPQCFEAKKHFLPQGAEERKQAPMYRGLFGYFPAALFEVAAHSQESDLRHNGERTDGPTWARGKSRDHLDCVLRHTAEVPPRGDPERIKVLRAVAWRALAALQEECEYLGARPGVSSRF